MSSRFDGHACPTWVRHRRNRPTDYNRLYDELKEYNGTVKTDKISCLLQKSGLQSQQLDRIWNLINNKTSYLSEQEFCILMAFVALSQKGTHVFDVKTLFKLVQPPAVPDFSKSVPLGQLNASRHNQSQPTSQGQMYSFINQSQGTDLSPDDEFSEFQSGLTTAAATHVPDQNIQPQQFHLTPQFPQKLIPFSPVHVNSTAKPEAGTEVGSRLANYDLGYTQDSHRKPLSTNNFDSLIGEEDKYSAFRVFLQDEQTSGPAPAPVAVNQKYPSQVPVQPSVNPGDFDFGDFQSFSNATTEIVGAEAFSDWTMNSSMSLPIPAIPIAKPTNPFVKPNFIPNPAQIKLEESQDDFGEFVTFTDNQASVSSTSPSETINSATAEPSSFFPVLAPPQTVFPSFDINSSNSNIPAANSNQETLLEQDLNSLDLTNTTYDFTSQSQPVGTQDSPLPKPRSADHHGGLNLNFPFDLNGSSKMNLQLKTTKIGNSNPIDPFDEFTSFESSSEIRNNNHGGGGATNMDLSLSTSAYEIKLKQSSPETQSVCSLDLGNYGGWEFTENRKSNENIDSEFPRSENQQNSKNSIIFASGDGNDKYNCFNEELEITKSRCIAGWKRCMRVCVRLIESAVAIFNSVSSSEVMRQIISSEKGHLYVLSLREVYLVACRIYHSWIKMSADDTAGALHRKLALAWDSFVPFLVGTALEENVNQPSLISEDDSADSANVCGICLMGTKGLDNFDEDSSLLLDYGGSLYHLACANLWVNEVDSVLPSLYR